VLETSRACAFAVAASPSSSSRYATVAASDTSARMRHASIPVLSCARFALDMRGALDTARSTRAVRSRRRRAAAQKTSLRWKPRARIWRIARRRWIHQQNSEEIVQERHT
jgi:hypothetical protein